MLVYGPRPLAPAVVSQPDSFHRPEDDDFDMEEELKKLRPPRPPRQPELEARSRRGLVGDPRVGVIHEGRGNSEEEESDSDGPILYRDDAEEDDEDVPISKQSLN